MSGPPIIPYHVGKNSVIASEQPGELLYSLEQVPPNTGPGASGYAQGTPLTWTFKPPAGRYWIPSETYLEVQMSVWGTTGDADPQVLNLASNRSTSDANTLQSVAPLAPACLFDSLAIEVNGKQIESINTNVAQHAAIRWRLSNKAEQRAAGKNCLWGEPDRINPMAQIAYGPATDAADSANAILSGNAAYVTVAAASNAAAFSRVAVATSIGTQQLPCTQTSIDRQVIFSQSRKQSLFLKLPLAICHQNLPVPSANFRITAQVTNQLARALQTINDSGTGTSVANSTTHGAAAVQIQVNNLDMFVAYSDYGSSGLYTGNLIIPTNPLFLTSYALSTTTYSDYLNITGLPPTALRYGFALQRASANSGTANHACSPTEFHVSRAAGRNGCQPNPSTVANAQNPVFAVTAFQATIGGRTAPNPTAYPRYSSLENNMHKWYKRFELASGLEEAEDIDQWLARGPIYMFPSLQIKSPDDRSTDMVVRMERDQTATAVGSDAAAAGALDSTSFAIPTNLLVFAISEKALVIETRGGEIVDITEVDR